MQQTVLILGGTGRFGRAAAEAFWNAGWRVRAFDRAKDQLPEAAMGADVIVNGWNPTYDRWAELLPGLTDRVIEAARASGATVIQPANVYIYGAGSPEVLGPDTPHAATNPLGRLRIAMEEKLRSAGVPVILLRAGDFIDTEPSGNWLDRVLLAHLSKGRLDYPGNPDIPHAWAYLPDLGRAAVALAERRGSLARVEEVLFPGYTLTGRDLVRRVAEASGRPVRLSRMAWWPLRLARPFWRLAGGLLEMRYLWDMPHRLDGTRFAELVPDFPATPVEDALGVLLAACSRPEGPAGTPSQASRFSMKRLQGKST
jgi:nucleoside-diphosphate-sugar epimerase